MGASPESFVRVRKRPEVIGGCIGGASGAQQRGEPGAEDAGLAADGHARDAGEERLSDDGDHVVTAQEIIVGDGIVVIGVGSIGQAIARRISAGKQVLLADLDQSNADAAAEVLGNAGFEVSTLTVDVSSRHSVQALAGKAAALGEMSRASSTRRGSRPARPRRRPSSP